MQHLYTLTIQCAFMTEPNKMSLFNSVALKCWLIALNYGNVRLDELVHTHLVLSGQIKMLAN
jgi:hypothetical protein